MGVNLKSFPSSGRLPAMNCRCGQTPVVSWTSGSEGRVAQLRCFVCGVATEKHKRVSEAEKEWNRLVADLNGN